MTEFILNDRLIKTSTKTGLSLLNYIREIEHQKGTKSGCKEGDCGACTVLVGDLQAGGKIVYKSVTSCLTPLANAHGKHIVTVEGINAPNELTQPQHALRDYNGTQCGFCTPGFVMSLTGFALEKKHHLTAVESLGGNICRCTGYKSIEKAAAKVEKLVAENSGNIDWLVDNNFIPAYFKTIKKQLKNIQPHTTVTEDTLVGGGTDVMVRHADNLADELVKRVSQVTSAEVKINNNSCTIGGATTVTDFLEHSDIQAHFPKLKQHLKLVSSQQIRNMGTIAGNFVNASPIGDMSVFFLALNAELKLTNENLSRTIKLKDFFKDYKVYDLNTNEIISSITFDLLAKQHYFNFEKVSKRTHLDIATVNSAIKIQVEDNTIVSADVAIGGVAAIPKHLTETSQFLKHKPINANTLKSAELILQSEISPISDVRGTVDYKRLLAKQLFYAHFIELFPSLIDIKSLLS